MTYLCALSSKEFVDVITCCRSLAGSLEEVSLPYSSISTLRALSRIKELPSLAHLSGSAILAFAIVPPIMPRFGPFTLMVVLWSELPLSLALCCNGSLVNQLKKKRRKRRYLAIFFHQPRNMCFNLTRNVLILDLGQVLDVMHLDRARVGVCLRVCFLIICVIQSASWRVEKKWTDSTAVHIEPPVIKVRGYANVLHVEAELNKFCLKIWAFFLHAESFM